jgi:acetyl esterase/lipase
LDVGKVIDKLITEKDQLLIRPEFGLIGVSAGAHISLMYDSVYDTDNNVKFVCDIVGPTDFTDPFYANNPAWQILLSALIDETAYPNGTNLAEATSPVFQVSATTSPSILFYGDQDPLVPLSNGESLETRLTNEGVTNSFTIYSGGHGNWDAASLLNLQTQLSNFINTHLIIN